MEERKKVGQIRIEEKARELRLVEDWGRNIGLRSEVRRGTREKVRKIKE